MARRRPADLSATRKAEREARALVDDVFDPRVSAEVSAKAVLEIEAGEPVPPGLASAIASRTSPSRAREVVASLERLEPESLTTIELVAQVAELEDDFGRAAKIREGALTRSEHPRLRFHLAHAYLELHRMADALELLEPLTQQDPEDELVGAIFADALVEADHHLAGVGSRRPCPCGSGQRYGRCCRPREQRAVERFRDPSPLYELREALKRYSERPEFEPTVTAGVEEWLSELGQAGSESGKSVIDEAELRLLVERTWYLIPVPDGGSGSSERTILERFADDPATAPHLARRARDWADGARYGLWQVDELELGPASLITDILTGTRLFASIPPEIREGLPRWTVIMGALIPVDGVWRTGAATMRIGSREGDDIANELLNLAAEYTRKAGRAGRGPRGRGGSKPKGSARTRPLPDVPAVEPGTPTAALNDLREETASPELAGLLSRLTASLLPSLYAEVAGRAARPVAVTNTDGDPLLFVTARVEVDDPAKVRARLLANADFEALDDDDTVAWLGREMTRPERDTAMAEARAFAERQGTELVEESDKPQRYSRGTLGFDAGGISVEVNSMERLDRLVAILREIGASPRVVSRDVVDPAGEVELLRSGGSGSPPGGGSAEAARAWQQVWLDEAVPALGGLTPREAAEGLDSRPLLESLLRDLEWRWESARARGSSVPDIDAIRLELGMEDWIAPYFEEDKPEEPSTSTEEDRRRWAVPPAAGKTPSRWRSRRPAWRPKPVSGHRKRHR
ncbi:MAG TPA: tetratricopeptide repeat protein [Actinomycetota bacterium]|nr:tetratricopeptide repeat protein [Actinomycetota bacterium]